jgi:hypothetical protein
MIGRAISIAAVALLAVPGAASGITPLQPLGSAQSRVMTDGARYAAYDPVPGVTRIIDTIGGNSRVVAQPEGCRTAGVGVGQLMWGCDDPHCTSSVRWEWPLLLDVATGTTSTAPLMAGSSCSDRHWTDSSRHLLSIGRSWISYGYGAYHVT